MTKRWTIDQARERPTLIREAFRRAANDLVLIREEWIKGDAQILALLGNGMDPSMGSFARIGRAIRHEVWDIHDNLTQDVLPLALPFAEPDLRARIQRIVRLTCVDERLPDRYGEVSLRWRQTWPATGLEPQVSELVPLLEAAGEAALNVKATPPAKDVAPKRKLPNLQAHDTKAWQLSLAGSTQKRVAEQLNAEYGTTYQQGQVSKMIKRAKAHAEASGLADKVPSPPARAGREFPMDPSLLDQGPRLDPRRQEHGQERE